MIFFYCNYYNHNLSISLHIIIETSLFPRQIGLLGMVEVTIEDFAFTNRSSRESDKVKRRGCIEHDFTKG